MSLTLLLLWFPIILGVGVGGRLLGRTRGFGLGLVCAAFWVLLVQASPEPRLEHPAWTLISLIAGAIAIIAMGGWSGETPIDADAPVAAGRLKNQGEAVAVPREDRAVLDQLSSTLDQFDDWLEEHRNDSNPWTRFDEFLRTMLYQACRATHVRPYRLLPEGEELVPLREPDPFGEEPRLSARRGIVGHVITAGRSYLAHDGTQGELVAKLAEESAEPIAWCFAVTQGTRRLGVVTVGHLDISPDQNKSLLRTAERLVARLWGTLQETCRSRSAVLDDPVSGVRTREAFFQAAEQSLSESYAQGEPVAVAVIALERLRELNDLGRWEMADQLVREAGTALCQKVRMDDRIGRFDGSRFVLLLRRVDSELASLIIAQIVSRLTALCGDESRWPTAVGVRCGVVGSGTEHPSIRTLVTQALAQGHRARQEDVRIASDLRFSALLSGAGA